MQELIQNCIPNRSSALNIKANTHGDQRMIAAAIVSIRIVIRVKIRGGADPLQLFYQCIAQGAIPISLL